MIPYGKQNISEADIKAVVDVLSSDFLTQGPAVPSFEQAICDVTNARFAVACNSATSALHVAVTALGLGGDDILWTSPISFVASANVGRFNGANVDFVDIDPETFNMCPKKLEEKLKLASLEGNLPKVLIPVHMCGQSPDMHRIGKLAKKYGIAIVEDASHAIGASFAGEPVGNCKYSDITVFSFHPVKIITTGEGGIATTNNKELKVRMERIRSHGITRNNDEMVGASHGPWYYQQIELGWNYRMTDLQAALGLSQLSRLETFVKKRNALAHRYNGLLADLPLRLPVLRDFSYSSWHLFVIRLREAANRRRLFESLKASGIGVNLHYIPIHLHPYYQKLGFAYGDFPASEAYYESAISIPMFADLELSDQDLVVAEISRGLS